MSAQTIDFVDPVPESAFARVAITGPSGAGKTWTALLIARGMAGQDGTIGLVDTEHKTATKYRKYHDFKVCDLGYYDPRSLITAVARATERRIDALVVDSFSHFWSGAGGVLAQVDQKAASTYSGNKMGGWKDVRPLEAEMMEALLGFPGHLIVTMRVKSEWVLETQQNGKTKPVKVGLKPEQRDGIDYEWDLVGGLDTDHLLTISKTRIHEIGMGETISGPDIEFGARIAAFLREGATPPKATAATVSQWRDAVLADGVSRAELEQYGRAADEAGAGGVIVTDLAGGTITFGNLVRERWRAAAPHLAAVRPDAPPDPEPASPARPAVAEPAAAAPQQGRPAGRPVTTDVRWLETVRKQVIEDGLSEKACRTMWVESAAKVREGTLTKDDATDLQHLLGARIKDARDEALAAALAVLPEDDPWAVKIAGLSSLSDAGEVIDEVQRLLARKKIDAEKAGKVIEAVTIMYPDAPNNAPDETAAGSGTAAAA